MITTRTTMNKVALNEISERLRAKGFDIVRRLGEKTKQKLDLEKEIKDLDFDLTILHREVYYIRNNKNIELQKIERGFE